MTAAKMIIIVPTRSRPDSVSHVVRAWQETGAPVDGAALVFATDDDDPAAQEYADAITVSPSWVRQARISKWTPMVYKLNTVARWMSTSWGDGVQPPFAIGFAGDDHRPRTAGWARRYLAALAEMGTGIVSCPDGYRPDDLPTQWAMTSDIVRALGRMVPAPVEHLFCDDAIRDLGQAAECWRYLPDVLIEHMHPLAKKSGWDAQYKTVNSRQRWADDRAAYNSWLRGGLEVDVAAIRDLIDSASKHPAPVPYREDRYGIGWEGVSDHMPGSTAPNSSADAGHE